MPNHKRENFYLGKSRVYHNWTCRIYQKKIIFPKEYFSKIQMEIPVVLQ